MDAQNDVNRGEFTWKISNFSEQGATKLCSEAFTVSGCKWRIITCPKGSYTKNLSLYLNVPDSALLPNGWTRNAKFSLSVINQICYSRSIRREKEHNFTARESNQGFTSFIPLTELGNWPAGYLANDTLVIKAEVSVFAVTHPVNIQPARPTDFDSYITGLKDLINADENHGASVGSSSSHQDGALTPAIPSLEEVEKAKQSLKECLLDLFKLNMKERLSEALSTLSSARTALSRGQQRAIETFQANFNDFTSDFLIFEQDNAEFELQKLQKDQLFSAVKKCHETHIMYKQLMDGLAKEEEDLAKEEEELKRKMEEVKSKRAKLLLDRETLWVKSEEVKSRYKDKQKKVAVSAEKKRIAEERMSRSITAWSNLKAQFCLNF